MDSSHPLKSSLLLSSSLLSSAKKPSSLQSNQLTKSSKSTLNLTSRSLKSDNFSSALLCSQSSSLLSSKDSLNSFKELLHQALPTHASYETQKSSLLTSNLSKSSLSSSLLSAPKPQPKLHGDAPSNHLLKRSAPSLRTKTSLVLTSKSVQVKKMKTQDSEKLLKRKAEKPSKKKSKKMCKLSSDEKSQDAVEEEFSNYELPVYKMENGAEESALEIPTFLPPDQDSSFTLSQPLSDMLSVKQGFINIISASLIRAPDFKDANDAVRLGFISAADSVCDYDAEFILKVALYTRKELNIRSTANFLLAYASNRSDCRLFLRKYFSVSVHLPSDWIDVAEQYQVFHDKTIATGSLPSALRRVMLSKFPEFDKYQLAKYNKESSIKKKQKKQKKEEARGAPSRSRGRNRGRGCGRAVGRRNILQSDSSSSEASSDEDEEKVRPQWQVSVDTDEDLPQQRFTIKQLIRKLHVTEPVEHVMSLIGKKYPETSEEFYKARLPGVWDETKAGKRMKLPIPETWETQVAMKGNKASTWESLLDHKKLPFMAMLRNLRNMLKAGISSKHHNVVLRKLTDEGAVINSRQFPFRFFSAYEVLNILQKEYEENLERLMNPESAVENSFRGGRGGGRGGRRGGRGGGRGGMSGRAPKPVSPVEYDPEILIRYKKALDTSVKIATTHNITPIRGTTLILCDLTNAMLQPCTSGRGLGKPRNLMEVGVLLGLMCKHSSEDCSMLVYGSSDYRTVDLEKGTILDNMESVIELHPVLNCGIGKTHSFPSDVLSDRLKDRTKIENLIILSSGLKMSSSEGKLVCDFLQKYRIMVNSDLLFANIDLSGDQAGVNTKLGSGHPNDISIAGYSDQILRFIAERGDSGQLLHVENIDKVHSLKDVGVPKKAKTSPAVERPLALSNPIPQWRTARVFISSTFRDMHGERDLLTRFVFPELRSRAKKRFVNIYEVDLRWGITEEDSTNRRALELCLQELALCQFFVGMLGERYGWIPDSSSYPTGPEFDWMREYPGGSSVTELEMQAGALSKIKEVQEKAFIFLRDSSFEREVPKSWVGDFTVENSSNVNKIHQLKSTIRGSGLEVYENYPCHWGGVVDGKPIVAGLERFASRVLNNLWNAVQKFYPADEGFVDDVSHTSALHNAHATRLQDNFVGRSALLKQCLTALSEAKNQMLLLVGKPGSGKSALMASLVREYASSAVCTSSMLVHFVGAAPGSTNITAILRQLSHELVRRFSLKQEIPGELKNLVPAFADCLKEAALMCASRLVLFLDGVDLLDDSHHARNMEWLPKEIPQNVVLVVSVKEKSDALAPLLRHEHQLIQVGPLDIREKALVVRQNLARHRKQLDESAFNNQMKVLLSKREANLPLFLTLACEELRVFGIFEEISAKLRTLPHTLPLLLKEVLARLESDHDPQVIASSLLFLLCSRNGLTERDLLHLLSLQQLFGQGKMHLSDAVNMQLTPESIMPKAKFSRIVRSLNCFMRPTSSNNRLLTLGHGDICFAVRQRYLTSNDIEQTVHSVMAVYYYSIADPTFDRTWNGKAQAAFAQLPYHLACSAEYTDLFVILSDLGFIEAKSILGMAPGLLEDFHLQTLKATNFQDRERRRIVGSVRSQAYLTFVSSNIHILSRFPKLCLQQAINENPQSEVFKNAKSLIGERSSSVIEWTNRPRFTDPCIYTMDKPEENVSCIASSRDGQSFAVGTNDNIIRLYDMNTCKELQSFVGHSDPVTSICFVGSDMLCSASIDNTLSLWSLQDGHRISVMKGHKRRVTACVSNQEWIVSVGWDTGIRIWAAKTGEAKGFLAGQPRPLNCVAFKPVGENIIATGGWDSAIRMWDVFHKKRVAVLRGHLTSVRDLAFSPCASYIASASLDGEVKLWSAHNGIQVGNLKGHHLPINQLSYTPSGLQLMTASDDCKIKVWSGHLGKMLFSMSEDGTGGVTSTAFSPDGGRLVCGCHEGQVLLYDVLSGCLLQSQKLHSAAVRAIAFSSDGSKVASGSDDTCVKLLSGPSLEGHTRAITCLAFGNRFLASTSEDSETHLFLVSELSRLKKNSTLKPKFVLRGHNGIISCCALNQEETHLVTGGRDMDLHVWELESAVEPFVTATLSACHADWINTVAWSNTGDFIVTGSNDFSLKLWDMKTLTEKQTLVGHLAIVSHVAYKFGCIVSSSLDGNVKIWSHKGTEITTLHGHSQRVNGCDINVQVEQIAEEAEEIVDWAAEIEAAEWKAKHDVNKLGKNDIKVIKILVATCSDDSTTKLWLPLQGNEIASLTGHSKAVTSLSCSSNNTLCSSAPKGEIKLWKIPYDSKQSASPHNAPVSAMVEWSSTLVTASRDGFVCIWSLDDSSCNPLPKLTMQAHEKEILSLALSDGLLVTTSTDCTIRIWSLKPRKENFMLLLEATIVCESPVSTVKSLSSTSFVITTQWNGKVSVLDLKARKIVSDITESAGHCDWILAADSNCMHSLLTCSANGKLKLVDLKATEDVSVGRTMAKVIKSNQDSRGTANWLTSAAMSDHWAVVGDLNGQLTKFSSVDSVTKLVHKGRVTACATDGQTIVTASTDGTIKLWNSQLIQIGQFFCKSSVISLLLRKHAQCFLLVTGDELGNVNFMQWKPSQ